MKKKIPILLFAFLQFLFFSYVLLSHGLHLFQPQRRSASFHGAFYGGLFVLVLLPFYLFHKKRGKMDAILSCFLTFILLALFHWFVFWLFIIPSSYGMLPGMWVGKSLLFGTVALSYFFILKTILEKDKEFFANNRVRFIAFLLVFVLSATGAFFVFSPIYKGCIPYVNLDKSLAANDQKGIISACNSLLDKGGDSVKYRIHRGIAYKEIGRKEEAEKDFLHVLKNLENYDAYDALYFRGLANYHLNHFEAAMIELEKVVASRKESHFCHDAKMMMGDITYKRYLEARDEYCERGDFEKIIFLCGKIIQNPGNGRRLFAAYLDRGYSYLLLENSKMAKQNFDNALAMIKGKSDPESMYYHALINFYLGEYAQANDFIQKATNHPEKKPQLQGEIDALKEKIQKRLKEAENAQM